jgi:prepilin-type N-terminal cleavage/methylation domain-containing protein
MKNGFTLIELMTVIAIITTLSMAGLFTYAQVYNRSRVTEAIGKVQEISEAVEAYNADVGFYPPDAKPPNTNPGQSPGLTVPIVSCDPAVRTCPAGWNPAAADRSPFSGGLGKWNGPYLQGSISAFPSTPWKGKYEYDYFINSFSVAGCTYPAGVYIAILPPIPPEAEQAMIKQGFDSSVCPAVNGEVRHIIKAF